jgi:hypothetical protein
MQFTISENMTHDRKPTAHRARDAERNSAGFTGVDGEGIRTRCLNDDCDCLLYSRRTESNPRCRECGHAEDSHYHAYVLLGIGDQYIDTEMLGVPELTWEHAFEFMWQEFTRRENRYKIFCGFFLGYDFTQIFKSLPERKAWALYNPNGNQWDADRLVAGMMGSMVGDDGNFDPRPYNPRKPNIGSRMRAPQPGGYNGKPWPVRISGERGSWEFDTLDERQLRLRPFNCGCADIEYHARHCTVTDCIGPDHHLKGKLCKWKDGECKCDDATWHGKHCKLSVSGQHPAHRHHSTAGCTRKITASIKEPEWLYVNDVGSFFQKSFLGVINPEDWFIKDCLDCQGTPCVEHDTVECASCNGAACAAHGIVTRDEFIKIREGKSRRATAVLDDEMREYNALENLVLARVMVHYKAGLEHFGITLGHDEWYGPGAAAGKWIHNTGKKAACNPTGVVNPFDNNNLPIGPLREIINDVSAAAYRGGWFELLAHGHVPGTTWEYDVNSAYPHIIRGLPCLIHGRWEAGRTGGKRLGAMPKAAAFRFIHATVRGSNPHIGTMLHRTKDGGITRPRETHGWFLQSELESSRDAGLIDEIEIGCDDTLCAAHGYDYKGVLSLTYYASEKCGSILQSMEDMYLERIKVGKNTSMGKAAKLVYNSVYGKFAQLIGQPRWANNVYACLITAGCREIITNAIGTHPQGAAAAVMVATDGVYFTSQHPSLALSGVDLGKMDVKEKVNMTLFKPGVYWDDATRADIEAEKPPVFKARGVNTKDFAGEIKGIDAKFSALGDKFPETAEDWPSAQFGVNMTMITCRQALMWGKWHTAGKITTSDKRTQDSIPKGNKRRTDKNGRVEGYYDTDSNLLRSYPPIEADIVAKPREKNRSTAYMRENTAIGEVMTADGDYGMTIAEALGTKK